MTQSVHEKFGFDTVFDDGGGMIAAPRPQRTFTLAEVEAARAEAFAAGERQGLASMAALQAQSLAAIGEAARHALETLAGVAHAHRTGAAELALACGRAMAAAALERFPAAPLEAALESLAREVEAAPRLVASVSPDLAAALEAPLHAVAERIGFAGQIVLRPDAARVGCAFTLDFGDGSAAYDPAAAAERVGAALTAALAAEGLHAEPLIPGTEG